MRLLAGRLDPLCSVAALVFAAVLLVAGATDVFWSGDFYVEAYHPALLPLTRGDWSVFFAHLPGYATFTVLVGGPAALAADALGGGDTATFRLAAVPGLLALAALGAVLGTAARRAGRPGWPLAVVLGAGGPLAYQTV
ncbi:MAG TPA: hypothetical protein VN213_02450, partial [Solirubrobacteraceae bacterium]|nr:hypothetical protein [Solirubrobacteraceae bacterium]